MLSFTKNMLARFGFWILLPISAIQGLRLRATALRLPEAKGDKSGISGQGIPIHLLALGDSIIAGTGILTRAQTLPVRFALALSRVAACSVHWRVEGSNGADISQLLKQVRQIETWQKADVVLISIGVNDVTGLSSKRHWQSQLMTLIRELRIKWPQSEVIFAGLPPMARFPLPPQPLRFTLGLRAATLDKITADIVAEQPKMFHIPTEVDPLYHEFCEDGFHPSADACSFWAEKLAQRFKNDTLATWMKT